MTTTATVDRAELEAKVKDMYRHVALEPKGEFHFEMGRTLAERLGYAADLDCIPAEAAASSRRAISSKMRLTASMI
jgi:arsenite methyltransferase